MTNDTPDETDDGEEDWMKYANAGFGETDYSLWDEQPDEKPEPKEEEEGLKKAKKGCCGGKKKTAARKEKKETMTKAGKMASTRDKGAV